MSIESIVDDYLDYLQNINPSLNDTRAGSVLYTLARSFAFILDQVEQRLNITRRNVDLSLATGYALETIAKSYNINYLTSKKSKGSALAVSDNLVTIPANTILYHYPSYAEYKVTQEYVIQPYRETVIEIEGLNAGQMYNVDANQVLISELFPNVSIRVGARRNVNGVVEGNISGGISPLSDDDIRAAILQKVLVTPTNSDLTIRSYILTSCPVSLSKVVLNTNSPGVVSVWLYSSDIIPVVYLDSLKRELETKYLGVGIICNVKPLTPKYIDISISGLVAFSKDLSSTKEKIQEYLFSLRSKENFKPELLSGFLGVGVIKPVATISIAESEIFILRNLSIL